MVTQQRSIIRLLLIIVFLFVALGSPQSLLAAAPYYEGKHITIVVGFGPGGGYDRVARLLAKYLPKYIPGKPAIIVENMPGADSLIAANYVYNRTKPNGLVIGSFDRGIAFSKLRKTEGARFDITKYSWIGSAATEATVLAVRTTLPYKTFDDLLKSKSTIMLGCAGAVGNDYYFPTMLKAFAGLNMKLITYPSSSDIMLAIERKEVDGKGGSYSSILPSIKNGQVRPLIRGRASSPDIENLPVDQDITSDSIGKAVMAMAGTPDQIGRPYVAPPGTPAHIMKILRNAFDKVVKDPDLQQQAAKINLEFKYVPAEECLKVLNYLTNQPPEIVKEFGKYVNL